MQFEVSESVPASPGICVGLSLLFILGAVSLLCRYLGLPSWISLEHAKAKFQYL